MTFNNIYVNERCVEMRALVAKLAVQMRDGQLDELRRTVGRINALSDELVNRLHDLNAAKPLHLSISADV